MLKTGKGGGIGGFSSFGFYTRSNMLAKVLKCFILNNFSRVSNDNSTIRNIFYDYCSSTNSCPFSNFNSRKHTRSDTYVSSLPYSYSTSNTRIWRNMNKICNLAVMLNNSTRVYNAVRSEERRVGKECRCRY